MSRKGKKLGEILVEDGLLSEGQVELALERQKTTGEFLGNIFVDKGWISESQLLSALSEQFDIPVRRFDVEKIDWSVPPQYPASLLIDRHCFPLRQDTVSVTVAINDPLDAWTISEIESQSRGRQVHLVLMTKAEIAEAIEEFRKRSLDKR